MTNRPLALLNARLIDPSAWTETRGGLLIIDGVIADLGGAVTRDSVPADAEIIDCAGDMVAPGLIDVSRSNLSTEWAAGGLVATAPDLARVTLALRDGRILSPAAVARMTTFRPADDPGQEAGEGLFREPLAGATLRGYDGGVLGFGAVMGWLEHEDLVIVVMTNVGSMHSGDAAFFPLRLVRSKGFVNAVRALAAELAPR